MNFLTSHVVNYDFLSIHLYTSSSNKNHHWKVSKINVLHSLLQDHKGRRFNTDWKNELQIYIVFCGEAEGFSVSNPR